MDEQPSSGDEQELPRNKAELVERMEQAYSALMQTIDQVSDAELTSPGPEGWSAKDHLAHLAVWELGMVALLQRQPRFAAMGVDESTYLNEEMDDLNRIFYQRHKERPLVEVVAGLQQVHRWMLDELKNLEDADLFKTYSHYQPNEPGEESGDPIMGWIVGNTYEHYAEHQAFIQAVIQSHRPDQSPTS